MALERPYIFGLHDFAQGAVDFLVGAATLSVVIGLVASALEDVARPPVQRRIFQRWLSSGYFPGDKNEPSGERATKRRADESSFGDFFHSRLDNLPEPFFALQPDQLCAQIIRRLQASDSGADGHPERHSAPLALRDDDGWSRWGERCESGVDELQVKLARSAVARSYVLAVYIAAVFGALMYALARPNLEAPALSVARMLTLTAVFGGVAILLSPIIQSLIARFLRPR